MADHLRIYRGPEPEPSSPSTDDSTEEAQPTDASESKSVSTVASLLEELDIRQNEVILQIDQLNQAVEQILAQAIPQPATAQ